LLIFPAIITGPPFQERFKQECRFLFDTPAPVTYDSFIKSDPG